MSTVVHAKSSAEFAAKRTLGNFYDVLCMLTLGEAKSVIREVSGGDGIAAWQALAKSYARRTLARVLRRSMNPGVIARREAKWKELERTEGVRLPDMVKVAALTELFPPDIRDLIFETVDYSLTFDTMTEKVISWASNKVASRKEMPISMDIGRLKDIQDWDGRTHEEEWHEVGAVRDSSHRCGGVGHYAREVPQSKVRAKATATEKASTVPGPKNGNGKGKERAWAKVRARLYRGVSACYGCGEHGHRVACCPKWKTFAIEQNEEVEARKKPCKCLVSVGMLYV